jgi:hypothetical protein
MADDYESRLRKLRPPFGGAVRFGPGASAELRTLLTDFSDTDRKRRIRVKARLKEASQHTVAKADSEILTAMKEID